jgi:lipopolysaccharide biosynthesis regulator YciM
MDLSLILLGLPLAFLLGWWASRIDLKQLRVENRQSPKAYFKGLNFLLNEQQDQAIDAFIEAVQLDPDTSELHFALGNLFRKRGEYDRAVRVHEHLIARADLSQTDRDRAHFALAMDYLRAGILDRAEAVLQTLLTTSYAPTARLALLSIYERTRDWAQAAATAQALQASGEGNFDARQAHYLCEQAARCVQDNQLEQALVLLESARVIAPRVDRPQLEMAHLLERLNQPDKAYDALARLIEADGIATPLAAPSLARLARQLGRDSSARQLLDRAYARHASLDVLNARLTLTLSNSGAANEGPMETHQPQTLLLRHLQQESSLIAAEQWLQMEHEAGRLVVVPIEQAIAKATRPLRKYRCAACGFETQHHYWNCPGCQAWDSYPPRRIEEL